MTAGNDNHSRRGVAAAPGGGWRSVLGQSLSLVLALGAAVAALGALLWMPLSHKEEPESRSGSGQPEVVHLDGPRRIAIKPGGPLGKKLDVATAQSESIVAPLLTVTGSV